MVGKKSIHLHYGVYRS